jgi:hypothetical protein
MLKNVSPTEKKLSTTKQISGNTEFTRVIIKFQEKLVSSLCYSPSMFKNTSQTERRLCITGQTPATTEFTNAIMKYQEKMKWQESRSRQRGTTIHHYVTE